MLPKGKGHPPGALSPCLEFFNQIFQLNFSSSDIVRSTWLFTPLDPFYYDDEQTMYHTKDDNTGIVNPLAMIDKDANGYQSLISRWFQSAFSLRWDMP